MCWKKTWELHIESSKLVTEPGGQLQSLLGCWGCWGPGCGPPEGLGGFNQQMRRWNDFWCVEKKVSPSPKPGWTSKQLLHFCLKCIDPHISRSTRRGWVLLYAHGLWASLKTFQGKRWLGVWPHPYIGIPQKTPWKPPHAWRSAGERDKNKGHWRHTNQVNSSDQINTSRDCSSSRSSRLTQDAAANLLHWEPPDRLHLCMVRRSAPGGWRPMKPPYLGCSCTLCLAKKVRSVSTEVCLTHDHLGEVAGQYL